jgi:hypothetical protein
MDVIAWLFGAILSVLSFVWGFVWFLISGWVSTLAQIAVLIAVIYVLKYGWQRAPFEIWNRTRKFARFFWNWIRAREPAASPQVEVREIVRVVRAKDFGDINVSTLLSLLTIAGLLIVAQT